MNLDQAIQEVFHYFSFFEYPPSFPDLFRFLPQAIKENDFRRTIERLEKEKKIISFFIDGEKHFCLAEKREDIERFKERYQESRKKIKRIKRFLALLKMIPSILLVGISGSVAMLNSTKTDDVDIFIITSANKLWTTRFLVIMIAQFLGLRSTQSNFRVCFNLFFDEDEMTIPRKKHNLFVAHELLQMKPMINKNKTYEKLLSVNHWVIDFFPNVHISLKNILKKQKNRTNDFLEDSLKKIQLKIIKKRLSEEVITDHQLWLIQNDFEKKIAEKIDIRGSYF